MVFVSYHSAVSSCDEQTSGKEESRLAARIAAEDWMVSLLIVRREKQRLGDAARSLDRRIPCAALSIRC